MKVEINDELYEEIVKLCEKIFNNVSEKKIQEVTNEALKEGIKLIKKKYFLSSLSNDDIQSPEKVIEMIKEGRQKMEEKNDPLTDIEKID